jgi:hypothetical protein
MMGPALVIGGLVITACGSIIWYLEKKQPASVTTELFLDSLTVAPNSPEPRKPLMPGSSLPPQPSAVDDVQPSADSGNSAVRETTTSAERTLNHAANVANLDLKPSLNPTQPEPALDGLSNEQLNARVAELCLKLREFDQGYRDRIDTLKSSRTRASERRISQIRQERAAEFKSKYFREANALFRALLVASRQTVLPLDTPRALRIGNGGGALGPALTSATYLERLARRAKR